MRNWTRSILLSLLLAGLCFAPPSKPIRGVQISRTHWASTGLVAYWILWEGAGSQIHDVSGHGITLTHTDIVTCPWAAGEHGYWLDWTNGSNGDELIDNNSRPELHNLTEFSYGIWLHIDGATEGDALLMGTTKGQPSPYGKSLKFYQQSYNDYTFRGEVVCATTNAVAWCEDLGWKFDSDPSTAPDRMVFVVMTYKDKTINFYVDGRLCSKQSDTQGVGAESDDSGAPFTIGCGDQYDNHNFSNGKISQAFVYSRALTPAEVRAIHASPSQIFTEMPQQLYVAGGAPPSEPERPQIIFIGSLAPLTILVASLAFASCKRKAA